MAGYFTDKNKKLHQFAGGDNSTKYCLPVGTIFPSAIPLTDASVHLLDGSTISQTGVYQEFAELVKSLVSAGYNISCSQSDFDSSLSSTGNCGKFVIDNTSNTIRLPKITRFIQGLSNMIDIGNSIEAGLPNITGQISRSDEYPLINIVKSQSGALSPIDRTTAYGNQTQSGSSTRPQGISFDASRSSAIYGNSSTVQPQATSFPYYIVLANGFVSDVKLDVDNIMNEVNSKLPLAGGTLSGNLAFPRGKGIKTSGGANMLEWNNSTGYITLGVSSISTLIAGYSARPVYNTTNNPLALLSDVKVKHGYKTFNSSYCTGTCNWFRVGQAVFVVFQDVVFTANPPDQSVNILTSALPKNIVNTIFFLTPHTTTKGNARLAITTAGYVVDWWANLSLNENYAGFIGYVAQDGE